jgi:hypothetical protein
MKGHRHGYGHNPRHGHVYGYGHEYEHGQECGMDIEMKMDMDIKLYVDIWTWTLTNFMSMLSVVMSLSICHLFQWRTYVRVQSSFFQWKTSNA